MLIKGVPYPFERRKLPSPCKISTAPELPANLPNATYLLPSLFTIFS